METGKKIHKVKQGDFYRLCEFLKHRATTPDWAKTTTFTSLAQVCTEALGVIISSGTVREAMNAVGVTFPAPPEAQANDNVYVARQLVELLKRVGDVVPDRLRQIAKL